MLKVAVISVLAAVALAQLGNIFIDSVHGYRVEYDDRHNIVMMVDRDTCYVVEAADGTWDNLVRHKDDLHVVTEELYNLIRNDDSSVESITHDQVQQYHSRLEEFQCRSKRLYRINYSPSTTAGN